MQNPTGRNLITDRGSVSRTPRDCSSASVSRDPPMTNQPKSTRKSSAEINRTVNDFVNQSSKMGINGFPSRNDSGEQRKNLAKPKLNAAAKTMPKQIVEMQAGFSKNRHPPSAQSKAFGAGDKCKPTATSLGKGSNDQADSSTTKPAFQNKVRKEVRIAENGPKITNRKGSGGFHRETSHGDRKTNYSKADAPMLSSALQSPATKFTGSKDVAQRNRQAQYPQNQSLVKAVTQQRRRSSNDNRLDYYTTSSSDDECSRPPKGTNAPRSPASQAKMWNDINNSPGPTYPGWKFRSPPEGRHLSQIGSEELTTMFKNMKIEAQQAKDEDATPRGSSKFSDYMRKMKTSARAAEEMTEASLQQNLELKKVYAEQLDAMQQRAWDSLQALDANVKRNADAGLRTSFDKFMEGTSRTPNRITVGELVKSRAGNFRGNEEPTKKQQLKKSFAQGDVVQADDFSSDDSDMGPPSPDQSPRRKPKAKKATPTTRMEEMLADIRSTRRSLAQGDCLRDVDGVSSQDSDKLSNPSPRPSRFGDSARAGAVPRMRAKPNEPSPMSRVTADQFKSLADEEDPLKKLKKISEKLKLDNARMLTRRAPQAQAIHFSSSDDEPFDYGDPCKY